MSLDEGITLVSVLAGLYALACVGIMGFQMALILGAPWGRITQGGAHEGALPTANRIFAGVSIGILVVMALGLTAAAGLHTLLPTWTGWLTVGLQALITLLNWITRSAAERQLWAPIMSAMLVMAVGVMILA